VNVSGSYKCHSLSHFEEGKRKEKEKKEGKISGERERKGRRNTGKIIWLYDLYLGYFKDWMQVLV